MIKNLSILYGLLFFTNISLAQKKALTDDEKWQYLTALNNFISLTPTPDKKPPIEQIDIINNVSKFDLNTFMRILRSSTGFIEKPIFAEDKEIACLWPAQLIDYLFDKVTDKQTGLIDYKFKFTSIDETKLDIAHTKSITKDTIIDKVEKQYSGYAIPYEGSIETFRRVNGEIIIVYAEDKSKISAFKASNIKLKENDIIKNVSINNNLVSFQSITKYPKSIIVKAYNSRNLPLKKRDNYINFPALHFARDKNGDLIQSKELRSKADDIIHSIDADQQLNVDEMKNQEFIFINSFEGKIDHITVEIPEIKVIRIPIAIRNDFYTEKTKACAYP